MIRFEIYAHESLEKPVVDELLPVPPDIHDPEGRSGRRFSMIRGVAGRGASGTSMGDDIWPESNIKLILYASDDEADDIRKSIEKIRAKFPKLGLAVFVTTGFSEW